jgi:hypothetical protein
VKAGLTKMCGYCGPGELAKYKAMFGLVRQCGTSTNKRATWL